MFLLIFGLILQAEPSICYYIFNSRDALVSSVIDECRRQIVDERDHLQCYTMLGCILNKVPVEYTARWSAGANILGFLPTMVALMSNSIDEMAFVADESVFLAIALSVSSIATFNSRFGHNTKRLSDSLFDEQISSATLLETVSMRIHDLASQSWRRGPLWHHHKVQSGILGFVVIGIGAGVWYEVLEITKYGVVVFACPIKDNIAIWVGLSQLLAFGNIVLRKVIFGNYVIQLDPRKCYPRGRARVAPFDVKDGERTSCRLVLRYARYPRQQRLLRSFNALASFALYAYGTVILASVTLVPASDAIRAMAVTAACGGFGRLAASFYNSYWRRRSQVVVLEVPFNRIEDLKSTIENRFGARRRRASV